MNSLGHEQANFKRTAPRIAALHEDQPFGTSFQIDEKRTAPRIASKFLAELI